MNNAVTEVGEFFSAWELYRKVLTHNYMNHEEVYQAVKDFLAEQWADKPFKLLDLGCGDASFFAKALQGRTITHYTGFDLSDPALALAGENLAPFGCKTELVNTDFMEGLARLEQRYDLIFTGFALHHLTQAEKAEFFRLAHAHLAEDGMLLLVDTMREPGETLPVYLDNYCSWIRKDWVLCDEEEFAAIFRHIRNYDFPETTEALSDMALAAGFTPAEQVFQLLWHQVLSFRKRSR